MSIEIISERHLTDEEVVVMQRATALLGRGYDRRDLLKLIGLSGAAFTGSFAAVGPAGAFVPLIIYELTVAAEVLLGALIGSTIVVSNSAARPVSGFVYAEYIDPDGLIQGQARIPVSVGAKKENVLKHKSFKAKKVGRSTYTAKVQDSDSSDDAEFEVVDA